MQFLAFLITVIWLLAYAPTLFAILACGFVLMFLVALALNLMGLVG